MQNIYLWDFYTLWEGILISANKTLKKTCKKDVQLFIGLLLTICFSLFNNSVAQEPRRDGAYGSNQIEGVVFSSETGNPVENATVSSGNNRTKTDRQGKFDIITQEGRLHVRHMGYQDTIIKVQPGSIPLTILLIPSENTIEEIEVVNTGYQQISRERATGSFTLVDDETLNRSTGMDLLSRLNGVTNGLLLDQNTGNSDGISVRGRSTLFSSTRPLIVVDNFPYEGEIDNINPNDIESVTVLKDATAASIWGVRSGNGVIVITTKKAKNQKLTVDFTTNTSFGTKPDLFYRKQMSTSDYIDVERWLFEQGYFDADLNTGYERVSPVVHLLDEVRKGNLDQSKADHTINNLKSNDIRSDLERYFYRGKFEHQHQLSIASGTDELKNILSVGLDRSLAERVSVQNNRLNVRSNTQWTPGKGRIKLSADIWYTKNNSSDGNSYGYNPAYPYERLTNPDGTPSAAYSSSSPRHSYADTVGSGYLLDWKYRPLEEIQNELTTFQLTDQQLRMQASIEAKLYRSFKLRGNYLAGNNWVESTTLYDQRSFYTRDRINMLSQVDYEQGLVTRPVPLGDILSSNNTTFSHHYGRAQIEWDESLGSTHRINGLLGFELRKDTRLLNNSGFLYGYDQDLETFAEIDVHNYFPTYYGNDYQMLNRFANRSRSIDHNRSWYGLLSYTLDDNLTITGSFRKDESNIFGVATNQKGVPLWSAGAAYSVQQFLSPLLFDQLKFRFTYGYNGNVDKSTTAYLTSQLYRGTNLWSSPMDIILNPPNNSLRWERVQNVNIGVDFVLRNNTVGGVIEYYLKKGKDLMGHSPLAPQTGVPEFYGNVASTSTRGIDIQLWAIWFKDRAFNLRTDLIFNTAKDRVDNYYIEPGTNTDIVAANSITPIAGNPINSLILYVNKGLSTEGNPLGWIEDQTTEDYNTILNGLDRTSIVLMGSKVPTTFGSLRQTFAYRSMELSFNIIYKFGYHLKRVDSYNSNTLIGGNYRFSDWNQRWKQPGDENSTTVPAFHYPHASNREVFYQNSDALAIRGDHIRLQDIRLAYSLNHSHIIPGTRAQFYSTISNLGLLWKGNSKDLDPSFLSGYRTPLEISFGFNLTF
ncbi:MAG: SusC/RagA family TonB-linked outer membrane protein [Sphingobacterium sp.]